MSHQVVNLLMNGPFNDKYLGPGSAFAFSEMNSFCLRKTEYPYVQLPGGQVVLPSQELLVCLHVTAADSVAAIR